MEELSLFARVILGTLFLSTSVTKFRKKEEHVATVINYRILPPSLAYPFARAEMATELAAGILLCVGLFQQAAALLCILLLAVYSCAIAINLVRGRREVSCGCGGIAGNHTLSWWLVLRNFTLMIMGGWLFLYPSAWVSTDNLLRGEPFKLFYPRIFEVVIVSWLVVMMVIISNQLWELSKRIKSFRRS